MKQRAWRCSRLTNNFCWNNFLSSLHVQPSQGMGFVTWCTPHRQQKSRVFNSMLLHSVVNTTGEWHYFPLSLPHTRKLTWVKCLTCYLPKFLTCTGELLSHFCHLWMLTHISNTFDNFRHTTCFSHWVYQAKHSACNFLPFACINPQHMKRDKLSKMPVISSTKYPLSD